MPRHAGGPMALLASLWVTTHLASCYKTADENDPADDGATRAGSETEPETETDGLSNISWIAIIGGDFSMGSESGDENELPIHAVTVASFEMMQHETTVGEFEVCVREGACWPEPVDSDGSSGCNAVHDQREDHPMNCVSWHRASMFCEWVGGRLPTEAEWEFAARSGGDRREYPWGDEEATCAFAVMEEKDGEAGCGRGTTWPVCSKPEGHTEQGLCDMAGNLWEWTADDWHESYAGAPNDGTAWRTGEVTRTVRGGCFRLDEAEALRTTSRIRYYPTAGSSLLGFRCIRSLSR